MPCHSHGSFPKDSTKNRDPGVLFRGCPAGARLLWIIGWFLYLEFLLLLWPKKSKSHVAGGFLRVNAKAMIENMQVETLPKGFPNQKKLIQYLFTIWYKDFPPFSVDFGRWKGQKPAADHCDWHEILLVVAASEEVGPDTLDRLFTYPVMLREFCCLVPGDEHHPCWHLYTFVSWCQNWDEMLSYLQPFN